MRVLGVALQVVMAFQPRGLLDETIAVCSRTGTRRNGHELVSGQRALSLLGIGEIGTDRLSKYVAVVFGGEHPREASQSLIPIWLRRVKRGCPRRQVLAAKKPAQLPNVYPQLIPVGDDPRFKQAEDWPTLGFFSHA